MELEHAIGYAGETAVAHPIEPNCVIVGSGCNVVITDLTDPHKQSFLVAHDAAVTALCASGVGGTLASGQAASAAAATREAPVIVWDLASGSQIYNLFGLHERVAALDFSADGRFLLGMDSAGVVLLWDLSTGEVLWKKAHPQTVGWIAWDRTLSSDRRPEYTIAWSCGATLWAGRVSWDVRTLRYGVAAGTITMPPTGFVRKYSCGLVLGSLAFAGTEAGEVAVSDLSSGNFRGAFPVGSNGVTALSLLPTADASGAVVLLVGLGDGYVKRVSGSGASWSCTGSVQLGAPVQAVDVAGDDAMWAVATTAAGAMCRVISSRTEGLRSGRELQSRPVEVAHTGRVVAAQFGSAPHLCVTACADGGLRTWDLNDYSVTSAAQGPQGVEATCLALEDPDLGASPMTLVAGWADGHVRAWQQGGDRMAWQVAAHRGPVTAVAVAPQYFASAGQDGRVCLWTRDTRELAMTLEGHSGKVLDMRVDVASTQLVHTLGADRVVSSWDVLTGKRICGHQLPHALAAGFTVLEQRKDSDQELLTGMEDGRVLFWDADLPDRPIQALPAWSSPPAAVTALAVSPTGQLLAVAYADAALAVYRLLQPASAVHHSAQPAGGELMAVMEMTGHTEPIRSITWAPDERQLVSVSDDAAMSVYNWYGNEPEAAAR